MRARGEAVHNLNAFCGIAAGPDYRSTPLQPNCGESTGMTKREILVSVRPGCGVSWRT